MTKAELIAALAGAPDDMVIHIKPIPSEYDDDKQMPSPGDIFDIASCDVYDADGPEYPRFAILETAISFISHAEAEAQIEALDATKH